MLAGAIIVFLVAAGIFMEALIASKLLYVVAAVSVIAAVCIAFDSATSQWLVQKVLNELSKDIAAFERDLDELQEDLKVAKKQIEQRDEQLQQEKKQIAVRDEQLLKSEQQLKRQEHALADITLIEKNMGALITSLMGAHEDGVNLNELFKHNLDTFQALLDRMNEMMDSRKPEPRFLIYRRV